MHALKLLTLLFLTISTGNCFSQHYEKPSPKFYIWEIDKETQAKLDLYSYLDKNIPESEENKCDPSWRIFYFRVTNSGKIDSLFHEGTLNTVVTNQIVKNIYSTQGHWKSNSASRPVKKQWFIYPYFDFGKSIYLNSDCTESQKLLQKTIIELAESIGKINYYAGTKNAFFMIPNKIGAGYDKE